MNFLKFARWYEQMKAKIYTRLLRSSLGSIGKGTIICPPLINIWSSGIHIGKNCEIRPHVWLDSITGYASVKYDPRLEIGDGTYIGHRVHISAAEKITLGRNVVLADNVYITDSLHGYQDVSIPVGPQLLVVPGPVIIEDEVWLGYGVSVMPNVTIGKHSVVGSNSVVTKDIPPYSVAVGSPAQVIKRYNTETEKWERS